MRPLAQTAVRWPAVLVLCAAPLCAAAEPATPGNPASDVAALLHRAIAACWAAPPAGDKAAVVVFKMRLTREGRLDGEPRLISPDPPAGAAALVASARRAILRCAPFTGLAQYRQTYHLWKDIDLRFDPGTP